MVGKEGLPRKRPPCGVKAKFKDEDDQLLRQLKEDFPNLGLTWKQISDFFPGRSPGTLQVRYCTKIRKKDILWNDDTVSSRTPLHSSLQKCALKKRPGPPRVMHFADQLLALIRLRV